MYEDLEEIAYLLKIADRSVRLGAQLAPQVRELQERPGQHTFTADSKEGQAFFQSREYRTEVLVLNKAIHEWLNHISVALKLDQPLLITVSPELRRKLSYIVLIRDKLLTHKKDLRSLGSGSTFYENLATTRVHRLPLGLPDALIAEINTIFERSVEKLPADLRAEENAYARFGLLVEYHEALENQYRARIRTLVENHGAECASLEELAQLSAQLAEEILLPLIQDITNVETGSQQRAALGRWIS